MKIGQYIYSSRKRKGISQEELASLLDVSRQSISLWETDQTIPTLDKLQAMSKIFEVSLDELTGVVPLNSNSSNKELVNKEERLKRKEKNLKIFEIIVIVFSLASVITWYLYGLGLVVSIISIILNLVSIKIRKKEYTSYLLVICVVFLFASIFRGHYL